MGVTKLVISNQFVDQQAKDQLLKQPLPQLHALLHRPMEMATVQLDLG